MVSTESRLAYQSNTTHRSSAGSMLAHRPRRRPQHSLFQHVNFIAVIGHWIDVSCLLGRLGKHDIGLLSKMKVSFSGID